MVHLARIFLVIRGLKVLRVFFHVFARLSRHAERIADESVREGAHSFLLALSEAAASYTTL